MDDIDSSIWSNLSEDILCVIIENSSFQSQVTWSCVSHRFYDYASTLVWADLSIKRSVPRVKPPSSRCRFIMNIRRKDHSSLAAAKTHDFPLIWGRPALLPLQRVKRLCVNMAIMGIDSWSMFPNQLLLKYIGIILLLLPGLVGFSFDGPFRARTLRGIVKNWNLQYLELRTLDAYSGRGDCYNPANAYYLPRQEMPIDFSPIGDLQKLRVFKIGHVVTSEAGTLAQGIKGLLLTTLEVSASFWANIGDDRYGPTGNKRGTSPIDTLVNALVLQSAEADLRRGSFPLSLRSLLLRDLYNYYELSQWETLWGSIQPCRELGEVTLDLMHDQFVEI